MLKMAVRTFVEVLWENMFCREFYTCESEMERINFNDLDKILKNL